MDGMGKQARLAAASRIREAMRREGYSAAGLAQAMTNYGCAVSAKTMRNWLDPDKTAAPHTRQLIAVCEILDMNATWFMFGVGTPKLSIVRKAENLLAVLPEAVAAVEALGVTLEKLRQDE